MIKKEMIGEVLTRLYYSEVNFRIENQYDGGYRWSLTGWSDPNDNEWQLQRFDIDDAIEGKAQWIHKSTDIDRELSTIHFQKRDWFTRGGSIELEETITQLCDSVCMEYPETDFVKWYKTLKK